MHEIFQTLEFLEFKQVKPCIWYNRYRAMDGETEIILDCILTYSNGLQKQVTVEPEIYSFLGEYISDTHYPNVPTAELITCVGSQIIFHQITAD